MDSKSLHSPVDAAVAGDAVATVDAVITGVTKWLAVVSSACLGVVLLLAVVDVLGAKFLNTPIPGAFEYIEALNVPMVFLAVAFVQLDRGHTRIALFQEHMPAGLNHAIRLAGHVLGALICGFLSWRTLVLLQEMILKGKTSGGAASLPLWPFVLALLTGIILLAIAFVLSFVREGIARSKG